MLRSIWAALMLAPLIVFSAEDDHPSADRDGPQGNWILVKGSNPEGKEISPEVMKEADFRLIIGGKEMINIIKGKSITHRIAIDSGKSPKQIDWTYKEGTPPILGIYRVKNDTLEIAWAATNKDERPTEFTPCPKDSHKKWSYSVFRPQKAKKTP